MKTELNKTINRAKTVARKDGYPQYIYEDNDGNFAFGRLYSNCKIGMGDFKRMIGLVNISLYSGVEFITNKNYIETKLNSYSVRY